MRVRISHVVSGMVAAGLCAALIGTPASAGGGRPFNLALSGAEEFNSAGAPINPHGDADRASMTLTLNVGRELVCWSVQELVLTAGEALPHAAHIHVAPAGTAGPVVVDLFAGQAPASYPTATRCISADRGLIRDMLREPSAYYVNMHNAQHPAGVVRAQLG